MVRNAEDIVRLLISLAAAIWTGWALAHRGWPVFSWLPAAILAFLAVGVVWIIVWYVRRKATYQILAARTKADLQAGGNGWPNHRRPRDPG